MHNLDKFEFLLGDWDLEYKIPKNFMSKEGTDTGVGTFEKILKEKYIQFEYSTNSGVGAKGIFTWDEQTKIYRYWWFEDSGSFLSATCNFINDSILAMNWHDSLLVQTFTKETPNRVILKMQYPNDKDGYDLVLEVIFTRK